MSNDLSSASLISYLQGISYQGTVLLLVTLGIALSFIFFAMALVQGGIYSAIAFGLCVSFPIVFMLLRLNVYNNSSRLLYVGKEDGMDCYEQVWGYHPVFYYIFLGIPFGRGPLGLSFKKVLDSIFLHVGSLEYSIIYFIFCLIIGCFILSPDIANKIVPFEIKTFEGTKKFIMISLALIFICLGPLTF